MTLLQAMSFAEPHPRDLVSPAAPTKDAEHPHSRLPALVFGAGLAGFMLFLLVIVIDIRGQSDFPREAWAPYQALFHGHLIRFLQTAPAYVGSLVLRAPFALAAHAFGAGMRVTYIATALPCVLTPALLAGWLVPRRYQAAAATRQHNRRLWPLDLFMFTPPAIFCITMGHPEDLLGGALCVAAVLLAQRGSARTAGVMLGLALINKSWAACAAPLAFALLPPDRRVAGLITTVIVTSVVLAPVEAIRMAGPGGLAAGLEAGVGNQLLVPELLWFFGANSLVVQQGHIIVILGGWIATGTWWWLCVRGARERPRPEAALLMLALVFFLRAVLDPWDNNYYFVPFMLALMTYEDGTVGFPKLSWMFAVMLVIVVPPAGLLNSLGNNGHAAVFAIWALAVITFFGRRALLGQRPRTAPVYAAASRSGA
jgi:hypothetical protein